MSKATLQTPPLHVLRGIYRLLKTPELPKELQAKGAALVQPTAMQRMVLQRYRDSVQVTETEATHLRSLAVQYHNIKLDLRERNRLYQLDTGAEEQLSPKELSRRAAARAGLQLPDLSSNLQ